MEDRRSLFLYCRIQDFALQGSLASPQIAETGWSKRSHRLGAGRSMSGGVLFLYVDAKSTERNEAYEAFSPVC